MDIINWVDEFGAAVTVSDKEGNILYMNNKSADTFSKYGGRDLVGTNLRNCHKQESWDKIAGMINNNEANCYTIEKNGIKKLIYQSPWYQNGTISGMVEISIEIPFELQHFIRK